MALDNHNLKDAFCSKSSGFSGRPQGVCDWIFSLRYETSLKTFTFPLFYFSFPQKPKRNYEERKKATAQNQHFKGDNTSSYFWVRASLSSSDMSGLRTTIVSYFRSPGGHWGSSLSSRAAANPVPGGAGGSSSDPNPPSKKELENSRVWAFTDNPRPKAGPIPSVEKRDLEGLMVKGKEIWWVNWGGERGFEERGEVEEVAVRVEVKAMLIWTSSAVEADSKIQWQQGDSIVGSWKEGSR